MKWNSNLNEIPPKTEVLVLTDMGERLIARRNRKNGKDSGFSVRLVKDI